MATFLDVKELSDYVAGVGEARGVGDGDGPAFGFTLKYPVTEDSAYCALVV